MKRVISVFAVIILAFSLIAATACSSSEIKPTEAPDSLSGTYELVSIKTGDTEQKAADLGIEMRVVINGDKATFTTSMSEDAAPDTQTRIVDTEKKQIVDESGEALSYRIEGTKLILEEDGSSMTFEKQQ